MGLFNTERLSNWIIPLLLLVASAVFYLFDPEKLALFPKCPFHVVTGYYCPGCGSQRAIHSFLHFRFYDVFRYNALMYPAAALILYHYARKVIVSRTSFELPDIIYKPETPWVIFIIIIVFWIARNIPHYPLMLLSPG